MLRIAITGASGFIGQSLCKKLNDSGYEVIPVVRKRNAPNEKSIGDIKPDLDWSNIVNDVDVVIHLIARVHIMNDKAKDPLLEFRKINVDGTLNLAQQAAKAGVKRFIYLSSIKVNGEFTFANKAFTENDIAAPIDPYGISKLEAEIGLYNISKKTGMEVVCIRPPLVYGPGVKANFHSMMKWLYWGVPLPFGSVQNRRSLVALDNLVDFIFLSVEHPAAANQTFLVSDDEDLSMAELLNRIAIALKKKPQLLPVNQKMLELSLILTGNKKLAQRLCGSLQIDISKAKKLLNWKPIISIDEELKKTAGQFYLDIN
jgi:nucleoside-diphosphate-sugar epimerase